jgi:hypothetical protein
MKLTTKTDLEAPIGFVYATLADFPAWEREAVRHGVEIERPADTPLTGKGATWRVRAQYRGKLRKLQVRVDDAIPDDKLIFTLDSASVEGTSQAELISLSPRRTRLRLTLEVRPKTLAARLFINTLRLAKRRVDARFDKRVAQLAARIEEMYQRSRNQEKV